MMMPIGMVARSPRTSTQATVSHPATPWWTRSSKSRKLGMRMVKREGNRPSEWKSTWPLT
jgi:hypothetical protein